MMPAGGQSTMRVVGRYALYNEIAAGGMATIHLGRLLGPVGFARTVAVKRLHPQFAKDPEFVSMFLDEARLAARVQHPNVVATIDVVATDGELFLIMDYVRGESLAKILRTLRKKQRLVPPRIAASIICGFLHGLHAAHEASSERGEPLGLVHRDVSPQNVLVGSDGIARVLDFGIAKAQGRVQVTRDGQIKGKLAYMPPEQLSGRELSRAVDIYASAVVMWETLTNERLFKGESERETLTKILRDPVAAPSTVAAGLPTSFDAPILKALSRDPAHRHATAKELALALERCCGIASPSEVGAWVEEVVGPILDMREAQIAVLESSSVGLKPPESRPPVETPDSDPSFSSQPKPLQALAEANGPGSAPQPGASSATGLLEEATTPTGLGAKTTGFTLSLPIDRSLAIIASVLGVIVLFVVVVIVVAGKASGPAKPTNASAAAASSERENVPPAIVTQPSEPIPTPRPLAATSAAEAPSAEAEGTSERRPPTVATPTPKVVPVPTAPKTSAHSAPKKNCDPPFNIDASGRKKYKIECM